MFVCVHARVRARDRERARERVYSVCLTFHMKTLQLCENDFSSTRILEAY